MYDFEMGSDDMIYSYIYIYIWSYTTIGFRRLSNITVTTATIWEAVEAVELNSYGMIYIPSFMNIGIGVIKLIGEDTHTHTDTDTHTNTQQGDRISLLLFFQNNKSRLKR
jgi:hypothetical protein